jgi:hypothetical protein
MTTPLYSSVSFNEAGPAKSPADLSAIQRHNNREEPLEHVVEGAPPPKHLTGTADLRADVCSLLIAAGIDVARRRSNGVLAYEIVFGADHDFFTAGTPEQNAERLAAWVAATLAFVLAYWGVHRVASVVLHLDEYTPHLHVVAVPLYRDAPEAVNPAWRLVGRVFTGPGKWAQLHTDYALAVAHLGLQRGKVGSERKRKPYGELLREMKDKEAAAAEALQKAQAMSREALLKALENLQEEQRLQVWASVLQTQAEKSETARRDLASKNEKLSALLSAAVQGAAAKNRDEAIAHSHRVAAGRLRDLVQSAQAAATTLIRSVDEHARATPSPALTSVIEGREGLRALVREMAERIEADEALRVQRDLAWGEQKGNRR